MRKEVLVALCAIGLILGVASMANATTVTWRVLTAIDLAGAGPGTDTVNPIVAGNSTLHEVAIGDGADSTTGQNNSCNLRGQASCGTMATPGIGSYSLIALEMPQTASCAGGDNAGDPCTDLVGSSDCPGTTPLGIPAFCQSCPDDPTSWDTFSYMGAIGNASGTLKACQENNTQSRWTAISLGSSESIPTGFGATCVVLRTSPSSSATNCGLGAFSSSANIKFALGCIDALGAGQIDNLALNGRIYDKTDPAPAPVCNYTSGEIQTILGKIPSASTYGLIMCGATSIPNDSSTTSVCLRGATVWDMVVAHTAANVTNCTDPNPGCVAPGPCAGGVAEAAE